MKPNKDLHQAVINFDALPNSARIPLKVVCEILDWSQATIWRKVKSGQFPPPKKYGPRSIRWSVAELREYMGETK